MDSSEHDRILELDIFRGIFLNGMLLAHLIYDLERFYKTAVFRPVWLRLLEVYGHIFFILLSGLCATFSRNLIKRGLLVLAAAFFVSYATLFGELILGLGNIRIWFGILHMLGCSMLLYSLLRKAGPWLLAVSGFFVIFLGERLAKITVSVPYLFPLGLCAEGVDTGSDFFPIFPGLGWFLLGAVIGRTLYKDRKSRFPGLNQENPLFKFLGFCGRNSLLIYLLHQPVLMLLLSWI